MKKILDWLVYLGALALALPVVGVSVSGVIVLLIITFLLAPRA